MQLAAESGIVTLVSSNQYDRCFASQPHIYSYTLSLSFSLSLPFFLLLAFFLSFMQVYINRAILYTDLSLHASNWKRVVLGAVLMASKVWDDQAGESCDKQKSREYVRCVCAVCAVCAV